MGKRRSNNRRAKLGNKRNKVNAGDDGPQYRNPEYKNEAFEAFYKMQGIVPEPQWDQFLEALKRPLPTTFRTNDLGPKQQVIARLQEPDCFGLHSTKVVVDGKEIPPPTPMPWYPNNEGWYYTLPRHALRKVPELKRFREFLVMQDSEGNISRQEAVSMIPPLLLEVQPHHVVLDMCAAPGSKTAQLISALHQDYHHGSKNLPSGMVVANDADPQRAYMLVHQLKRLGSPNFMVTTHEGQFFPKIQTTLPPSTPEAAKFSDLLPLPPADSFRNLLDFDRVLCDVPCSGDGTMRKNMGVWRRWSPQQGMGLHLLQAMIASRGFELLRVGGLMVYSTCSFNPIENEAVLATLHARYPGAMEILDVSDKLPGLIREPGLLTWKVVNNKLQTYDSFESVPENARRSVRASMFPPPPEAAAAMHLERAMRVLPHKQDTGGFFIALIRKTRETKVPAVAGVARARLPRPVATPDPAAASSSSAPAPAPAAADSSAAAATSGPVSMDQDEKEEDIDPELAAREAELKAALDAAKENGVDPLTVDADEDEEKPHPKKDKGGKGDDKGKKKKGYIEDPFIVVNDQYWQEIHGHFHMAPEFPRECLMSRSEDQQIRTKRMYMLTPRLGDILRLKEFNRKLRIVHAGLRVFEKISTSKDVDCNFRVSQEGLYMLSPFLEKQVISVRLNDFVLALKQPSVRIIDFSPELSAVFKDLKPGGLILELSKLDSPHTLSLSGWKARASINVLVQQLDKKAYLASLIALTGRDFEDVKPRGEPVLNYLNTDEAKEAKAAAPAEAGSAMDAPST